MRYASQYALFMKAPAPTGLPTPSFWLDATNNGSITQSGGKASQINDLGTLGINFTQSTGANQPAVTTSTSLNGQQVLSFTTAGATWMTGGTTAILKGAQSFTLMLVISWHSGAVVSNYITFGGIATDQANGVLLLQTQSATAAPTFNDIFWGSSSWAEGRYTGIGWPNILTQAYPQLFELSYNGAGATTLSNFSLYYNKTSETISTVSFGTVPNYNIIGAPSNGSGGAASPYYGSFDFGEYRIYVPALSSADQATVRATLATKWGF